MSSTTGPNTLTDEIWHASRPPILQKLFKMPQGTQKAALLQTLFLQGFIINGPVEVQGWSVTYQFNELIEVGKYIDGKGWIPGYGYPQLAGPPSIVGPQGPMPAYGILISTDAADFPAWGTV